MTSRRETWARAICDTASAGRYLLPGRDLEFLPAFEDGGEVDVQAFLERLDDRGGSVELLASAYWLSQPEVEQFILRDLPVLLKNLGHGSRSSPPSVEPTFKGRVLWQDTILGRLSGAVPRGRYLVQHVEKSADIPENRLLKLFLTRIVSAANEMARRGTGALPQRFAGIRDAAARALSNTYLQGVELEHRINARMLATAIRHRDPRYSRLAHLARDFDQAVIRGKWAQILELLRKGWLAPVASEDLFELYVLILVMQSIEADLGFGEPQSYGLIQRGRSAVATYTRPDGVKAEIFFDQVPSGIFGGSSEYLQLVGAHHGITAQERRPDISVRFSAGAAERRVLVEVKESEDPAYMRDSVYKVLGYLRDFASIWAGLEDQLPKAVLVFPTAVAPKGAPAEMVLVSSDRADDLSAALRGALGDLTDGIPEAGQAAA
ncbi:MAG: hypothetical protein K2W81_00110 [Sphingomonas sp.]|uniref:hypothetical protein n=1 Tax=Sphingomonas sp. TaxID=28214 RepID=UPI0025DD152D|nr:hypothetical protein [Sphingomonas sp.]MBY0282343.1 hypothetical protein [Sphingomonas sp.]